MSREIPSDAEKAKAFHSFRSDLDEAVEKGVNDHESKMTRMGFIFLSIFVSVIVMTAFIP
jgi:hypothetical protein